MLKKKIRGGRETKNENTKNHGQRNNLLCSLFEMRWLLLSTATETGGWTSCMLGRQQPVHCEPCDRNRERRRGVGLGSSSRQLRDDASDRSTSPIICCLRRQGRGVLTRPRGEEGTAACQGNLYSPLGLLPGQTTRLDDYPWTLEEQPWIYSSFLLRGTRLHMVYT